MTRRPLLQLILEPTKCLRLTHEEQIDRLITLYQRHNTCRAASLAAGCTEVAERHRERARSALEHAYRLVTQGPHPDDACPACGGMDGTLWWDGQCDECAPMDHELEEDLEALERGFTLPSVATVRACQS